MAVLQNDKSISVSLLEQKSMHLTNELRFSTCRIPQNSFVLSILIYTKID